MLNISDSLGYMDFRIEWGEKVKFKDMDQNSVYTLIEEFSQIAQKIVEEYCENIPKKIRKKYEFVLPSRSRFWVSFASDFNSKIEEEKQYLNNIKEALKEINEDEK